MNTEIKKLISDKLEKYNMKYAAMDWNNQWFCFEKKPNKVDDMWDVKDGHFMRLHTVPTDDIDWRDSLVKSEKRISPKKVLTNSPA